MDKFSRTMIICMLLMIALPMAKLSAQVSTWNGSWEPWTHGTGTEANPFLIENAQQLAYLAYRVNNGLDAGGSHVSNHDYHYKLMVDVDLNGSDTLQWTPIGYWNSDSDYQCFGGYFDGNDHTILKLYINGTANRIGLFGFVEDASIENTNMAQSTVITNNYAAGGIVGSSIGTTTIRNCNNLSGKVFADDSSGGIIGSNINQTLVIINCSNYGDIDSQKQSGGIIGVNYYSCAEIRNSFNNGKISVSGDINYQHAGGIIGLNFVSTATITNCYNTGSISILEHGHSHYSAGIVGLSSYNVANIANCYNIGDITISVGNGNAGGIGNIDYGGQVNAINCYYLNTCGGNNNCGGLAMNSAQMRDPQFVTTLNQGQATPVWKPDYAIPINDGYPILQWQQITGVEEKEPLSVAVYPNPTNNHITISAECLKRITISNLFGQVIYERNVNGNTFEYDFSGYSEGLYLIRIETANGIVTKRVAVTR